MKAVSFNNLKEEYKASIICKNLGMLVEISGVSLYVWSEYDIKIEGSFNCKKFLSEELFLHKINKESIDVYTGRAIMFLNVTPTILANDYYIYSKSSEILDAIITACEENKFSYFSYTIINTHEDVDNLIGFYNNFGFCTERNGESITVWAESNKEKLFKILSKSDKEGWINL